MVLKVTKTTVSGRYFIHKLLNYLNCIRRNNTWFLLKHFLTTLLFGNQIIKNLLMNEPTTTTSKLWNMKPPLQIYKTIVAVCGANLWILLYLYSNEFFIARTYQVPQYGTRNQVQEPTLPGDSRTGTWFLVPLSDILVVFLFYTPHFINFIFRELNCFYYMNTRTTWYYHQRRTRPQTNTVFFYLVLGPEGIIS